MGNVAHIMDKSSPPINTAGRWAPLQNLMLCARAVERAMNREPNLPGVVVFYGPSGWGKSMAASYCANKFEAVYIECRSYFTRKVFVESILREMGIKPARTIAGMMDQAAEQLELSQRPLIVDEADYLADRNVIDLLRDLHEAARTTILLIGEERFPKKLTERERFHNRVLVWQPAQPANLEDARKLATYYCPGVEVMPDLLDRVRETSRNVARRICVNLDAIRDHCQKQGLKRIDLAAWGRRELYSGEAPARRPA